MRAQKMKSVIKEDQDVWNIKNRITTILMRYAEQANILDPMLPDFVDPCMRFIQLYTRKACAENMYKLPFEAN